MVRRKKKETPKQVSVAREFHLDFLNPAQELAWRAYSRHDLLFLLGPAGSGKTHLAAGFAINDILRNNKKRIIITRPVVESGESLGYLPGDFNDKVLPYMMPIYDCVDKITGQDSQNKEKIRDVLEIVPLAYMRGRTFDNAVFILDEAQNCTYDQIKLAISRLGFSSKMIITGDPDQSDLGGRVALENGVQYHIL